MPKYEDLSGRKFNRLKVLRLHHKKQLYRKGKPNGHMYYYLCQCECGNFSVVSAANLKNNAVKSCGCLQREEAQKTTNKHKIHGKKNSRIYRIWSSMKSRCSHPSVNGYERYGGRGIKVCDEWKDDFLSFYEWSQKNGYSDKLTIDRINVNGDYSPSNCRWISWKEQSRNTRTNHNISYQGKTRCLKEWSEILGINYGTLKNRIRHGWSIQRAFEEPVHQEKRRY